MKTKCIVNKLIFKNGGELLVSPTDIVVFVGANNCGKSQSLKDINKAFIDSNNNVIINKIEFKVEGAKLFEEVLKEVSSFNSQDNHYRGYGYSIPKEWIGDVRNDSLGRLESIAHFFVKQIDTRDRLNQCDPVQVVDRDGAKGHPIHYLVNNSEVRRRIDDSFFQAFGQHLQVERIGGRTNFLRIGDAIKRLNDSDSSLDDELDHIASVMDTYPKLHEQGDGMVSFTGVLLSLLIENYSVFLIDEPESFLHPPQARILGAEIPELLGPRQAFIATHSEHLIKGLLEVAPNRIKVVRIVRNGNSNTISSIDTNDISKIWKDTLLKQSNVFQGLFYNSVIICESDSDCQFYSSVHSFLRELEGKRENPFYVFSSTKSRMKVIVEALKPLNVDFRVIADLDLLREKNDAKALFEACGGNWVELAEDYQLFSEALREESNTIKREELKQLFSDTIDADGKEEYDDISLKELKRKVTLAKKWKALKENGFSAIPKEAMISFQKINDSLLSKGIHLVPKGELEGFVDVGGHGPKWVANVFERYPSMSDAVYEDAKRFVGSLGV